MAYKTALIVDDSKLARVTLRKKLQSYGIDVEMAESGVQAVEAVQQNRPEIVFMDHLMPELDGFEATQAIRKLPGYQDLPIIMCTGKEHDGYLEEALAIGANQILSKPPADEALSALLSTEFAAVEAAVAEESAPLQEETVVDSDVEFSAADLIDDIPELGDVDDFAVDESLDDVFADVSDLPEPSVEPVEEVEPLFVDGAVLEMAEPVEPAVVEGDLQSDPIAQALDEAHIQSLCRDLLEAERPALKAEILAAVPQPEAPQMDMQRIRTEVENVLDQRLADLLPTVTSNVQQQLSGEFEAMLAQRFAQQPQPLNASDIGALVDARVAEALGGIDGETDQKLLKLETELSHSLQATQASVEGLVAEALQEIEGQGGSDLELQVDKLYQQQAVLSQSVKGPKALAVVAVLLSLAVAGGVAFLHFMQ